MQNLVLDLAFQLCKIPSVTNNENLVCDYLYDYFLDKNFIVQKLFIDNSKRYNLFICKKNLSNYQTFFCTHLDTVPEFFVPIIDQKKEKLFARGACDAKGIAACMIYAFLSLVDEGFDELALLFTVGEETNSDGAKSLAQNFDKTSKFLVVGEPTDLLFASEQMGVLAFDLLYSGKKAHSALPHLGDSAINKLVIDCFKLINYDWSDNIINLGELSGGNARNIISDNAMAKFLMRINKEPKIIIETIKTLLSPSTELQIVSQSEPFSYLTLPNQKSFIATFGSDAPYLKNISKHIILTGPGSLNIAHQDNEFITFEELNNGYLHYVKIAKILKNGVFNV
jgi:acetylornithine deacetylase